MDKHSTEFKTRIYDLIRGELDLQACPAAESQYVVNEFADGKPCDKLYTDMLAAYHRVCMRLGSPNAEDREVDVIVNDLLELARYLGMKMYDYGWFFATCTEDPAQERPAV